MTVRIVLTFWILFIVVMKLKLSSMKSVDILPRLFVRAKVQTLQAGKYQYLFRNSFEINSDLKYDYQKLIDGLRCLFPDKKLIIELEII